MLVTQVPGDLISSSGLCRVLPTHTWKIHMYTHPGTPTHTCTNACSLHTQWSAFKVYKTMIWHMYIMTGLPQSLRNATTALYEYVSPWFNEVDFGVLHMSELFQHVYLHAWFILLCICFPGTCILAQATFPFLIWSSYTHVVYNTHKHWIIYTHMSRPSFKDLF